MINPNDFSFFEFRLHPCPNTLALTIHQIAFSLFIAVQFSSVYQLWIGVQKALDFSCSLSYNPTNETASQTWLKSCRKLWEAVLTTFLTIDSSGTRGSSGEDRFGKHGIRSGKRQKRTEKIRKKFLQFFGFKMPGVRISPLGPSPYAIIDTMVVYGDFLLLLQYPLIWVIS